MPTLPSELVVGRGAAPGPVTGGYLSICFGSFIYPADAAGATDQVWAGLIMPIAFRVELVSWSTQAAATANFAFGVYKHASLFQVSGATNLLSGTVDIDVSENDFALPVGGGTSVTLTQTARNIARGDRLFVAFTFDATGALPASGFSVTVTGFPMGVVAKEEAND